MLAIIGDYKFEINETTFDKLKSKMAFNFSTNHRLGNFDEYQNVGKYEESIEITGTLIAKSQKQLLSFESMAKQKNPVTFATGDIIKTVLIFQLEREKSNFLKDGSFVKQAYKMVLQVIGDEM